MNEFSLIMHVLRYRHTVVVIRKLVTQIQIHR